MRPNRNLAVLFTAHAILGCQMPVHLILGGLAGAELAGNRNLATLPISLVVLCSMFTAPVASLLMGRYGRRFGLMIGAVAGGIGGALATVAVMIESFAWLLAASVFMGVFTGFEGFVRFAASDAVPKPQQARAISWVLAAGLVNALIGPEIVRTFSDSIPDVPFAGAYAALIVVNLLGFCVLMLLRMPPPVRRASASPLDRPRADILRQPQVFAAMICGMVTYAVMSLVMTSTALAMGEQGYDADRAADVVRWHVFAMFAPSFVTGHLITRFGHVRIIATGLALLLGCTLIALAGYDLHHFYLALITLGFGWNFGFIGATSLLARSHGPDEQAFVQGLNDFLVFGLVAVASFSSGLLLNLSGWPAVQYAAVPAVIIALIVLWRYSRTSRIRPV